MKIQLLKRIVHEQGRFARKGDVIDVTDSRGAQLIRRQIAEPVEESNTPGKRVRKVSKEAAAETPTETRPSGSPTGQAITSSSLGLDRPRRGRPRKKQKAAPE